MQIFVSEGVDNEMMASRALYYDLIQKLARKYVDEYENMEMPSVDEEQETLNDVLDRFHEKLTKHYDRNGTFIQKELDNLSVNMKEVCDKLKELKDLQEKNIYSATTKPEEKKSLRFF